MRSLDLRTPLLLPLVLGAATSCGKATEQPPSVLLVSIDTLRADHVGTYGYERDTTPWLDRFAQESLVFERAFAPAPWTLISHMTMLTGLYPNQHGVVSGDRALSARIPSLAERLRAAGYQTVALYFEGWVHERHGFGRGFDVFRNHRDAEEAGEHLAEALAALDQERPFFLFLHLFDVHCGPLEVRPGPIYDCPPPYDTLFLADAAQRLPRIPEGELWLSKGPFSEDELAGLTALYDGGIRYVDGKLEQWIEGLRSQGVLENALVVVTADHGESLGQRGSGIRDHGGAYQEGIRVPLIVRLPGGARGGERIDATVHLADIVPTVLATVGVPRDARLPGLSLAEPIPSDRSVYGWSPKSYEMLVTWPRKAVRLVQGDRCILADLERNPAETSAEPLAREEFDRQMAAFRATLATFPPPEPVGELDAEARAELQRQLEAMGYLGHERDGEDDE